MLLPSRAHLSKLSRKSLGHGAGELKFYTEPKIPQSHRWSQEPDIQTILESDGSGCKAMGF